MTGDTHDTEALQSDLHEMPPSAKLVAKVLEYEGELTQSQLVDETQLSARTVRYALNRLEDHDIVESDVYFADARQSLYALAPPLQQVALGRGDRTGRNQYTTL